MAEQANLKIDRLILNIPGGSAAYGRRVAELVAAGLAAADGLPEAGDVPRLRVTISQPPGAGPEILARNIVAETLRALARNG